MRRPVHYCKFLEGSISEKGSSQHRVHLTLTVQPLGFQRSTQMVSYQIPQAGYKLLVFFMHQEPLKLYTQVFLILQMPLMWKLLSLCYFLGLPFYLTTHS